MTEDEIVGWHHQFNGYELGKTPGDTEGQEGLARCSPWDRKESDMTQRLNNNKLCNLTEIQILFCFTFILNTLFFRAVLNSQKN